MIDVLAQRIDAQMEQNNSNVNVNTNSANSDRITNGSTTPSTTYSRQFCMF